MPEVLGQHARQAGHDLASGHVTGPPRLREPAVRRQLRRLDSEFERFFEDSRSGGTGLAGSLSPGAREWLLDNDFIVADALENLQDALPNPFLRKLPGLRLPDGRSGRPRVESIAREIVRAGHGRVEVDDIQGFVEGYQEVYALRIAELWALPSFLRLLLLEDLLAQIAGAGPSGEVGPYILSLRTLAAEDWRSVVESLSHVENILRRDPAGVYSRMDFRSRDRYRGEVERIAFRGKLEEAAVATAALGLAHASPAEPREGHVGFYLMDDGRESLFDELGGRPPWVAVPAVRRRRAAWGYFLTIALVSLTLLALTWTTVPGWWPQLIAIALALVPSLGVAVALANWGAGHLITARPLPRLDVREGIPPGLHTLVAVPALLGSRREVAELLHHLETNYHGNSDPELTFVLLSDLPDAPTERTNRDEMVLRAASEGIRELNERHRHNGSGPFLLLHRPRRWNPREACWMGWERKRGKLAELNQLLLGKPSGLSVIEGDAGRLVDAPFVLTLDADTHLPRNAAARLVGTMAHPLNRPEVAPDGRINRGYSVLQPRIEVLPDPDGGTLFSRLIGGVQGLDLYAHAAFDVLQDLFDVGIFAGKGIYDVGAFEASLAGRSPENALLSHDLFEGAQGRAGFVSDLILLEDFPRHPLVHAQRAHRWIRGDWQILPWLLSPSDRLSGLSRWIIFDNLRRSLQPIALVLLLLFGWLLLPELATLWTAVVLAVIGLPFVIGTADATLRCFPHVPGRADLEAEFRAFLRALGRWALDLTLLPFEARNAADAIARTLHRVYRTRRGLLEWTSFAHSARAVTRSHSPRYMLRRMASGPVLAVATVVTLLTVRGSASPLVLLIASLWLVSPVVGTWVSQSPRPMRERRGRYPRPQARRLARRTWGYYERFQGPESHWLVPDHYQERPGGQVANRTSPTNVGMALMAAVTAWDLGFETTSRFLMRVRNTVEGLDRLTRYRGHFLNWYDTSNLEPLHPLFVSTVDSGNLAATFLVVKAAIREAEDREIWTVARVEGLIDTIGVLCEMLAEAGEGGAPSVLRDADVLRAQMAHRLPGAWRAGFLEYVKVLEDLRDRELPGLEQHFLRVQENASDRRRNILRGGIWAWMVRLRRDIEETLEEIVLLFPWVEEHSSRPEYAQDAIARAFPADAPGPTLRSLERLLEAELGDVVDSPEWQHKLEHSLGTARLLGGDNEVLLERLDRLYDEMDFSFLYDSRRHLFRIGFSVSKGELDRNHYDLLASEARIASVVALSKGDAPPTHWLHLGRPYRWTDRGPVLLSWAGTMFEYLMPSLLLRQPPGTVLDDACIRAVRVQRDHGRKGRIPWGMSESGYHLLSREGHYQYRAFGAPKLGLRRSEDSRMVVAPYASILAISLAPRATFANVELISQLGGLGPWGLYEALDFGPRARHQAEPKVVHAYMSHHHGMILAALGNYLGEDRLVERFHADPRIATVEPYLHERLPLRRTLDPKWVDRNVPVSAIRTGSRIQPWSPPIDRTPAQVHHVSGGELVVAVGCDGRGGSRWRGWSVVRGGVGTGMPTGGPDLTLLDLSIGKSWCPLPDPEAGTGEEQEVTFEPHRAEFVRKTEGIRTRMELVVPPDTDVEMRRVAVVNESATPRHLRLALAAELSLAPHLDDMRHPAFHDLFVRAEVLPGGEGVIFERRRRSQEERPPVLLASLLSTTGRPPSRLQWGTSREAFLGRGGSRRRPAALEDPRILTPLEEPHHPLDPMACAVLELDLGPWETRTFVFLLAVGPDRETVVRNTSDLRSPRSREWARIRARDRAERELLQVGASAEDPRIWGELLSSVLSSVGRTAPAFPGEIGMDLRQSSLWKWGISGDLPFVLVEGDVEGEARVLTEVLRAQRWWRSRGQEVEIVVANTQAAGYHDPVRERVGKILRVMNAEELLGRVGGVHLVPSQGLRGVDRERLRALAAVRVDAGRALAEQIPVGGRLRARTGVEAMAYGQPALDSSVHGGREPLGGAPSDLIAPSALGGFDSTGDYVVHLEHGVVTPAPWVNVIARDDIGFIVDERGGGFTWVHDAGEFRLTPWSNDPVLGLSGEAIYLRDEEDREVWTPSPGPLGLARAHRVRHGWGRTDLRAEGGGLDESVSWFLHPTLPVKVVRVGLRNRGERPRRISVTYFLEWVLGAHPTHTRGRLRVRFNPDRSAVLAQNPYSPSFSDRIAFLAADHPVDGMATDRNEFLGVSGPFDRVPAGLRELVPGERVTPEGPPCGVLQRTVTVASGEEGEVTFFIGAAATLAELDEQLLALRGGESTAELLERERSRWNAYLGGVRVQTPEPELDALLNGWLPYQTISSRLQGRTGFYQSSGAFGFRDQLQDVYTLLPLDPSLATAHLERAARHQFQEGDVLHWWHPGTTRGVRTRCSDDLLWLPWVLAHTVRWTGDLTLLDREVPFLSGEPLHESENQRYGDFAPAEEGSLLDHGLRALERTAGLLSPRGLPLIGAGDWNDGMDRVGRKGRGESVWLAWFFLDTCRLLLPLARDRGEDHRARSLDETSARVREAVEAHAWDGEWYRRAFFDDGTPLGSRDSGEARIDSIAQSWAVISRAADPARCRTALDSAWRLLVRRDHGIALLLTPPFSGEGADPGYIAAYPPGVRENGGQYTHAAVWLVRALAQIGDGTRAWDLLRLLLPPIQASGSDTYRYRVEPYVAAADVYGEEPHRGRGGWTWYTGSAGWIWRVAIEDVLGISRDGATLRIDPCIPAHWQEFQVTLRVEAVDVEIRVQNPQGVSRGVRRCVANGAEADPLAISWGSTELTGTLHVEVTLGTGAVETAEAARP